MSAKPSSPGARATPNASPLVGGEFGSGVFSNQIEFFRRRGKLRTKVRMRQLDQSLRTLGRRLALEVRPPELRSYDVRVDARRRDWPLQPRHNARYLSFRRPRVAGDNGLPAARGICATYEVELPSAGTVLVAEHVLGVNGAGQIDLQGRVDRNYIVVLSDDSGVVHVIHWSALDGRIVIEKVIHRLLPHGEGENCLSLVQSLAPVRYRPAIDQIDHSRAKRLGMDTEILAVPELRADQVGQSTHTHLQARAIGHHFGDHLADHQVFWCRLVNGRLRKRRGVLD